MTRPLQVYVDEGDLDRLEAWANARGWTKSQAVRAAVRALTRTPGEDSLLAASGSIDNLEPDLSRRFDHYLMETYIAASPLGRKGLRRARRRPRPRPRRPRPRLR